MVGSDMLKNPWAGAASMTVAAMLATPFARRGGGGRKGLTNLTVSALSVSTSLAAAARWGVGRTAAVGVAVVSATTALEVIGTRHGRPFGRYQYADALQPQVAGVPLIVPAAWWAMSVPAREVAHSALGSRSTPVRRVVVGAAALSAWDLFLDPQMVDEGYWTWERRGAYRGIPVSNYVGWFLLGAGVMAMLEIGLPPGEPLLELIAEYGVMAMMETVAFASFFADRTVAVIGGVAMLPVAALAALRAVR